MTAPFDTATLRKARGAFFTPPELTRYVAQWAVRSPNDTVLEPSCGEAAFLLAAADRLAELGGPSSPVPPLHGVELHAASAASARAVLAGAGLAASITVGDFFDVDVSHRYDAVIGNPPYVRFQDFSGEARRRATEAALKVGVPISRLASSWAAFTAYAASFLKRGGRLGLVLPAELLTVNYAAPIRQYLLDRFTTVTLVMFDELVFPEVLEEVVLVLADGYECGPAAHCHIVQARNARELSATAVLRSWRPVPPDGKWTPSLLSAPALAAYSTVGARSEFTTLESWGDTTLGIVSGNNGYFALAPADVAALGLAATDVLRLSPPGSRHLRGLTFTPAAWEDLGTRGARTYLFRPGAEPSPAARAYIAAGAERGVDDAYKCRVRPQWWRVPLVPPADLLLTYMNADTPRLCTNRARVYHLNSVHGVYLKRAHRRVGMDLLPLAALNSMTLLGAETVGRAYGGGMLKLEPREADLLPVPAPALVADAAKRLADLRPQMTLRLRYGRLADAARLVDNILLVGELGMSSRDVGALRQGYAELSARRYTRGKRAY